MATSTVPAAITALVTLLDAALADVDVHDGPPIGEAHPDWLAVAFDGNDNSEVVSIEQSAAGHQTGAHPRDEVFRVTCILNAESGGDLISDRRTRAFAILATVETLLRSNISLGGVVQTAQLETAQLLQGQTGNGAGAAIRFVVRCKSRI